MPMITINDTEIFYRSRGQGETVLLLHSSASTGGQWTGLCDQLSSRFHVVAPDFHGYGQSAPWCGRGALSLRDEARIAAHFLKAHDSPSRRQPIHVVGHSFGGAVALRLAASYPHRIRSLTLVEPVCFYVLRGQGLQDRQLFSEIHSVAAAMSVAAVTGDYCTGMAHFVDYWNGPGTWEALPEKSRRHLRQLVTRVVLNFQATLNEHSCLSDYRSIAIPTLLLHGSQSPRVTRRITELLARTLPHCQVKSIQGANHMLPITHPDHVNREIMAQLTQHQSRPFAAPQADIAPQVDAVPQGRAA